MTGGGFRSFTAGEVLTAANVQDFFMDQAVMNFAGTAARASAIPSPSAGMVSHIGGGTVQVYNGTSWVALGGAPNAVFSNTPSGSYTSGGTAYSWVEFTASGTLTVTTGGVAEVLVVGGGGGGGGEISSGGSGGGGGGGGYFSAVTGESTAGRDATTTCLSGLFIAAGTYTVTVGAGGTAGVNRSSAGGFGGTSQIVNVTSQFNASLGGGGGATPTALGASTGATGGGGAWTGVTSGAPGTAFLGRSGGNGAGGGSVGGGGGGGAGGAGANGVGGTGGAGGAGIASSISGSSVTRAAGGAGGSAGGGAGTAGGANTGNGGRGGNGQSGDVSGGAGGSGVVIVRVRTS